MNITLLKKRKEEPVLDRNDHYVLAATFRARIEVLTNRINHLEKHQEEHIQKNGIQKYSKALSVFKKHLKSYQEALAFHNEMTAPKPLKWYERLAINALHALESRYHCTFITKNGKTKVKFR